MVFRYNQTLELNQVLRALKHIFCFKYLVHSQPERKEAMPKQTDAPGLQEYPIADSSRKVYVRFLAQLDSWLHGRGLTDETLTEYVEYLFKAGKAPALAKI